MDTLKDNILKKKENNNDNDNEYKEIIKNKIEEYNLMMREKIKKMENKDIDE